MKVQTFEDAFSEMLSSSTVYVDQKRDEDCLQVEVELAMVDGSRWFQKFTVSNTQLSRWGTAVVSKS